MRTFVLCLSVVALVCGELWSQEYFKSTRGDEVGPSPIELDEESFLNLLSYEQPLEDELDWRISEGGFRSNFGSLLGTLFFLEQDFRYHKKLNESFSARVHARHALDFDSSHFFIQLVPEFHLNENWSLAIPANVFADKGDIDVGVGLVYRDPEQGFDFAQLSYMRGQLLLETRSDRFDKAEVRQPADTIELQLQSDFFDLGTVSFKIAQQLPSQVDFETQGTREEFERFSASLLHQYEVSDEDRVFLKLSHEHAMEDVEARTMAAAAEVFEGSRELYRAQLEYQHDLLLDDVVPARVRAGGHYVYFDEEEFQTTGKEFPHSILRREHYYYVGFRHLLDWIPNFDIEYVAYFGFVNNRNRFPNDPDKDGRDPTFQGKLSLLLRWVFSENAEVVLHPAVELDTLAWGGGGMQARFRF
jgi:hypothetical protein